MNLDTTQIVWFHQDYITNVLSLALLKNQFHITYDSHQDAAFIVHRPRKRNMYFRYHDNGLHLINYGSNHMSFVETVADRAEGYSERQVQDAKKAEQLRAVIGYPSSRDYKAMIKGSMLKNCPVLPEDVNRTEEMFGKNIPS